MTEKNKPAANIEREDEMPEEGMRKLSDYVWVKVTPDGEKAWEAHHARIRASFESPAVRDTYVKKLERDAKGYTKLQMWQVMEIFGPNLTSKSDGTSVIDSVYFTKDPSAE